MSRSDLSTARLPTYAFRTELGVDATVFARPADDG
jgi:hypothetical protein